MKLGNAVPWLVCIGGLKIGRISYFFPWAWLISAVHISDALYHEVLIL